MNEMTRKDTFGSVAVLATILVSAICGMFAIDVQATHGNAGEPASAACMTEV